jgi:arsenate reductase
LLYIYDYVNLVFRTLIKAIKIMKRKKALFVCHGNVGRSQMAEAFYNHFTQSDDAWSAGIDLTTPKRYPHPAEIIIKVMKEENIDISNKKVKIVTKEMAENSDEIFVMCKREDCPDFLLNHNGVTFWNIKDPYKAGSDATRRIRDLIKYKVLSII